MNELQEQFLIKFKELQDQFFNGHPKKRSIHLDRIYRMTGKILDGSDDLVLISGDLFM